MTLSMYQASAPVLLHSLTAFEAVLDKAAAHAEARKIDQSVFIQARLAPDMFAFARQIQIATDMAKGGVARLAGVEIPAYEDNETTIEALKGRIAKTLAFIDSIPADKIDGTEEKEVVLKMRAGDMKFTGQRYLIGFVIPNFTFHCATAYDILRKNGVDIGKKDFLGAY